MKSRDTFAPIGPFLVTADEIPDPQKLAIKLWNNGTLMQDFNTDDMAHKIPRCIEWVTVDPRARARRHPGHGHQPSRAEPVPWTATSSSSKPRALAALQFNVRDDLKRTWERETRLQLQEARQGRHHAAVDGQVRPARRPWPLPERASSGSLAVARASAWLRLGSGDGLGRATAWAGVRFGLATASACERRGAAACARI